MSAISKQQMLKWAAAWQVVMTYVIFYVNEFGVDTTNRLIFGIALFVGFLITFLKKDNTEKVVTATGIVKDFIEEHKEETKTINLADLTDGQKSQIAAEWFIGMVLPAGAKSTSPVPSEEETVTDEPTEEKKVW